MNPSEEVMAETALGDCFGEISVGSCNELEVAGDALIGTYGVKLFFF